MREHAQRGEVWMIDLGLAAKVRPCLLLTDYPLEDELALITLVTHTTALRSNRWELALKLSYLKPGAFHFQQILSVPITTLMRRLGDVTDEQYTVVLDKLAERLSL